MSEIGGIASQAGYDSTDHQTSYVFSPTLSQADGRPAKRQKVSKLPGDENVPVSQVTLSSLPALLGGLESDACVELRQRLFLEAWRDTEGKIINIIQDANESTLDQVSSFVNVPIESEYQGQIPTGLIVTGPNIASQELLFSQMVGHLSLDNANIATTLRSGDAPNLKTALKKIIREATNQRSDDMDGLEVPQDDGRKLLNYDLEALYDHVRSQDCRRVVVAFQDSEAFDSGILTELLLLFSSWLDRIPFVVLFGIATSVELFHERLPRGVTQLLHGAQFNVEQTSKTLEIIFKTSVATEQTPFFLGSNIVSALLERQLEHVQSLQTFVMSLRYAYMSHFYANPLSILLATSQSTDDVVQILQAEHFEALRMLPSFQTHVESLVEAGAVAEAKLLLESDDALLDLVLTTLIAQSDEASTEGAQPKFLRPGYHEKIAGILRRLDILVLVSRLSGGEELDFIAIYLEAFDGTLTSSGIVDVAIEGFKYMNGIELGNVLRAVLQLTSAWTGDKFVDRLEQHFEVLRDILNRIAEDFGEESISKYKLEKRRTKTVRTTIIAQRVHLSEQKSTVSASELEKAEQYTNTIDEVLDLFKNMLDFTNPTTLLFNEVFLFSSKSPNRQAFTPKPRFAIEQALCNPHSYLDCDCCDPSDEGLASSNPPTAILYQLYLETGGLINVYDLWSAFHAIVRGVSAPDLRMGDDDDGDDQDERLSLVLFYKALAELKTLGLVKMSRKKTDHLTKTAWRGL